MISWRAEQCIISVFQPHDKLVASGLLRSFLHLLIRGRRAANADVLADAHVKQIIVLRYKSDSVGIRLLRNPTDVCAAEGDASLRDIPQRCDQAGNRALAAAVSFSAFVAVTVCS